MWNYLLPKEIYKILDSRKRFQISWRYSKRCRREMYMSVFERAVDSLSEKLPSVAASCNASRCVLLDPGVPGPLRACTHLRLPWGKLQETRERERERERQEGMHTRKQRGALSHDECIMPDTDARARALFPVFGSHVAAALSTVTRCDTCWTNSEIFATPCTRKYPRGRVVGRAPVTHRTHNKRMRITNVTVRYRVSGDNYIGRKNDTELRASRWQREITLAMHFFSSLTREKLSCETAYTARSFLNATKRHGTTCLSGFSCLSPLPYISLQLFQY